MGFHLKCRVVAQHFLDENRGFLNEIIREILVSAVDIQGKTAILVSMMVLTFFKQDSLHKVSTFIHRSFV